MKNENNCEIDDLVERRTHGLCTRLGQARTIVTRGYVQVGENDCPIGNE